MLRQIQQCIKPTRNASQSTINNVDHWLSTHAEGAINEDPLTGLEQSGLQYHGIIEVLLIVGAVISNALKLDISKPNSGALTGLITWLYALILAALQLVPSSSRQGIPNLRNHLTTIYAFQGLFQLLLLWSAITHPQSSFPRISTIADFFWTSLLFASAVTSKDTNRVVPLEGKSGLEPSREPLASPFSKTTFSWVDPLVWKGFWGSLKMLDLWDLEPADKAFTVLTDYQEPNKTTALLWHLLYHFRSYILKQWICSSLSASLGFAQVLILRAILEGIENPAFTSGNVMWLYIILLPSTGITQSLIEQQAFWTGYKGCLRMRALLQGKIFAKILQRKASANDGDTNDTSTQAGIGTITNLMSIDAPRVADIVSSIHESISLATLQVIGCTILLWHIMGLSFIPGFIVLICFLFTNIWFSMSISAAQKEIMVARDERIQATSETLHTIRTIKFFAWERYFSDLVSEKRSAESKARYHFYSVWGHRKLSRDIASFLISFVSFLTYTIFEGKPLYPSVAFAAMWLFNQLKESLDALVDTNIKLREASIAAGRVENFLKEPETEKYRQLCRNHIYEEANEIIGFGDGSFCWNATSEDETSAFVLNVNVKFEIRKLNLIIGPTGSGKTSLLLSLLGELTQIGGTIYISERSNRGHIQPDPEAEPTRSVAYCAQQPWLVNANIKDNILFGSKIDEKRYRDVLIACALERDLEAIESGDQTLVGDKGVKLSGGQGQRIALARALYSNSSPVLLDDCFSSLDSHTAQWIFDNGIMGPLMRNRTCILVTHNIPLCLLRSHYVVVLENGKIAIQGTPQEVMASGKLIGEVDKKEIRFASEPLPTRGVDNAHLPEETAQTVTTKDGSSCVEESNAVGSIKFDAVSLYFQSIGTWWFWPLGIVVFVLLPLASLASNIWIRHWANQYLTSDLFSARAMQIPEVDAKYYLTIYALIGLGEALAEFFHYLWTVYGSIVAGSHIHKRLIESVYRAEFSFFDSTPQGQLMNRFSPDLDCVDREVAFRAVYVKDYALSLVISIALISSIIPGFLPAAVFIGAMYLLVGIFYLESSRDLKRLESAQKSQLFQQVDEAVTGITTIRAYRQENRFIENNRHGIDTNHRPWIYRCATNRWLAIRLGVTGALVAFSTGVFVILRIDTIDGGSAGLILNYAIRFTHNVSCLVKSYMNLEQDMTSVERIKAYFDVKQERDTIGNRIVPQVDWPSQGSIQFDKYTTRYRADLKPVLECISFKINAQEKIGVVGRTGAGKSSLALALIRGLQAEEGKILIDGIEIGHIPLQTLRESITFVPQDATLFPGTIRSNLDPSNKYKDEEILRALHCVGMIEIPETSTDLSHGQRQLLCLARAFLKDSKVLVMDEATASIDYATDAKIQAAIRKRRNTTIITIAHRLHTVIDYDKVLVLDQGKVAEFGHPHTLLRSKSGGLFKEMCQQSGHFEELQTTAKQAYEVSRLVDDE